MEHWKWKSWAARASAHIRFKPDRSEVEEELLAHIEDRAEELLREGECSIREAEQQALAAMGDADEVGRQLAAVHRPWLGYLWLWSRRVLILCIVVMVWAALGFSERVSFGESDPRWWQQDPASEYGSYHHWTELTPDGSARGDGYTFTVPAAVIWYNETYHRSEEYEGEVYEYTVEENTALYLTVEASTWLPQTDHCIAFRSFYAVDDLGNHYWSMNDPDVVYTWQEERSLRGNYDQSSLWSSSYEAWISSIDPEAEWIELRYDRDGRDVRLRIDLTGGEGA